MPLPEPLQAALRLTPGAVFHRCALQVNPYDYVKRYRKPTTFANEDDYNAAIVASCERNGISVVGLTDHHAVHTCANLREALAAAGITAFPGFETKTKDGVHAFVLFDPSESADTIDRWLGAIGATDPQDSESSANQDLRDMLRNDWPAVVVAGQVNASVGGLVAVLHGQARIATWTDERLLAAAIQMAVREHDESIRAILEIGRASCRERV